MDTFGWTLEIRDRISGQSDGPSEDPFWRSLEDPRISRIQKRQILLGGSISGQPDGPSEDPPDLGHPEAGFGPPGPIDLYFRWTNIRSILIKYRGSKIINFDEYW